MNMIQQKIYLPKAGAGIAILFTLPLLLIGCGPSAEVLEKQEVDTAKAYKQAAKNPPNLPPEIQERRKYRMEMDFGVTPEMQNENDQ